MPSHSCSLIFLIKIIFSIQEEIMILSSKYLYFLTVNYNNSNMVCNMFFIWEKHNAVHYLKRYKRFTLSITTFCRVMSRLTINVFTFEHVYLVCSEITTFKRSFLTYRRNYSRDKQNSRRADEEVEVSRFRCVSRWFAAALPKWRLCGKSRG